MYRVLKIKYHAASGRSFVLEQSGLVGSRRKAEREAARWAKECRAAGVYVYGSAKDGYVYGWGQTVGDMHDEWRIRVVKVTSEGAVL